MALALSSVAQQPSFECTWGIHADRRAASHLFVRQYLAKSAEQHRLIRHPQHGFPCSRICPPCHPAGPARGRILSVSRMDLWSVHLRLCCAFNAASSLLAQPQLLAFAKDAVAVLSQLARNRSRYQQTPWVYGSNYHRCMLAFATTLYAPSRSGFGNNACAASQRTAHESLHKPVIPSAEAEGLAQTLQHAAAFQLLAYLHCNLCAVFRCNSINSWLRKRQRQQHRTETGILHLAL